MKLPRSNVNKIPQHLKPDLLLAFTILTKYFGIYNKQKSGLGFITSIKPSNNVNMTFRVILDFCHKILVYIFALKP